MKNIINNSKKLVDVEKSFIHHPEFNVVCNVIFAALYNIEKNRAESINQFKKEVLSKRDNPKEYYKALIRFAAQ